jgi:hypothetical protein
VKTHPLRNLRNILFLNLISNRLHNCINHHKSSILAVRFSCDLYVTDYIRFFPFCAVSFVISSKFYICSETIIYISVTRPEILLTAQKKRKRRCSDMCFSCLNKLLFSVKSVSILEYRKQLFYNKYFVPASASLRPTHAESAYLYFIPRIPGHM